MISPSQGHGLCWFQGSTGGTACIPGVCQCDKLSSRPNFKFNTFDYISPDHKATSLCKCTNLSELIPLAVGQPFLVIASKGAFR